MTFMPGRSLCNAFEPGIDDPMHDVDDGADDQDDPGEHQQGALHLGEIPLCDGGDVYFDIEGEGRLPEYRLLPENVQPGEVLALLNAGAYTLAQASQYNARFLPAVVLIRTSGEAELIRKRDGFEDLIVNDL